MLNQRLHAEELRSATLETSIIVLEDKLQQSKLHNSDLETQLLISKRLTEQQGEDSQSRLKQEVLNIKFELSKKVEENALLNQVIHDLNAELNESRLLIDDLNNVSVSFMCSL